MSDTLTGRVVQHGADRHLVLADGDDPRDPQALWMCRLRGRLKQGRRERVRAVAVGDRVEFLRTSESPREGVIERVLPRANAISRPQPSGGRHHRKLEQVVVANLDRLWIVASLAQPPLSLRFVDRILAATTLQGVDAGLVLNKADLPDRADPEAVAALYASLGLPVLVCSAETGLGLDALAEALEGRIQAFVGQSGVGKSSLLGAIEPGLNLRVGSVAEKHGHGRHTTSHSRLYYLSRVGGWVADTPGMREFGVWGVMQPELGPGFVEIERQAEGCRFRDCLHRSEPGCAVREAVASGEIAASRYESYLALLGELPADELERDKGI